jgi:hypothetical protein
MILGSDFKNGNLKKIRTFESFFKKNYKENIFELLLNFLWKDFKLNSFLFKSFFEKVLSFFFKKKF